MYTQAFLYRLTQGRLISVFFIEQFDQFLRCFHFPFSPEESAETFIITLANRTKSKFPVRMEMYVQEPIRMQKVTEPYKYIYTHYFHH